MALQIMPNVPPSDSPGSWTCSWYEYSKYKISKMVIIIKCTEMHSYLILERHCLLGGQRWDVIFVLIHELQNCDDAVTELLLKQRLPLL